MIITEEEEEEIKVYLKTCLPHFRSCCFLTFEHLSKYYFGFPQKQILSYAKYVHGLQEEFRGEIFLKHKHFFIKMKRWHFSQQDIIVPIFSLIFYF